MRVKTPTINPSALSTQFDTDHYNLVDLSRSSQHPTAIPGGAECHNCEHPQLRCSMHCPEAYTSITSVPAGVYLFPNPRQRFALRIWPGTIQVSRSR